MNGEQQMFTRNTRISLLAAVTSFALLVSGGAFAGNNNTLQVTAQITGTCNFDAADNPAGNTTLDFGTLDQTLTADVPATQTSVDYWCTKGTTATALTAGNGQNTAGCGGTRCLSNGTDLIPYVLTVTDPGGAGTGKSNPITVTFDGDIVNADYIDVSAGNYTDLVTLTITP
jgi:Spore Coat Protein U domain